MPIEVSCHECSAAYRMKDELEGRRFACRRCGASLRVESSSAAATDSEASGNAAEEPRASRSKDSSQSASRRKRRSSEPPKRRRPKQNPTQDSIADPFAEVARDELEEQTTWDDSEFDGFDDEADFEDYRDGADIDYAIDDGYDASTMPLPGKRKKKHRKKTPSRHLDDDNIPVTSSLPTATFNPNRINLAMLVIGGVIVFLGAQEMRLGLNAGSAPVDIAFADLMADGPGDNIYFTISDVVAGLDGYVAEEDQYGNISQVWIPCAGSRPQDDTQFILYSSDVRTEAAAEALADAGTHTGMIVNDIKGLDAETRRLLRSAGIQPENALLFEVGRQPSGVLTWGSMLLGGLVIMLLGVGWIFFVHD